MRPSLRGHRSGSGSWSWSAPSWWLGRIGSGDLGAEVGGGGESQAADALAEAGWGAAGGAERGAGEEVEVAGFGPGGGEEGEFVRGAQERAQASSTLDRAAWSAEVLPSMKVGRLGLGRRAGCSRFVMGGSVRPGLGTS